MIAAGLACVDLVIISQDPDRVRIYCRLGLAAGAVGMKAPMPQFVQDRLGDDGAGRVAGAEKQHIEWTLAHAGILRRFAAVGWQIATGAQVSGAPPQQFSVRNPSSAFIVAKRAA